MPITKIDTTIYNQLQMILQDYPLVRAIVQKIDAQKGKALLVGGAVRDLLLGSTTIKDLDIEVYGIALSDLESLLSSFGPVSLVGKSFGVLRVHGLDIDWSLPRSDSAGRKPAVAIDPWMSFDNAFARRDVTINAMGIDLITHELIDPFDGQKDLKQGILRATDPQLFGEDPLRLYRVMQFISRFAMTPDETLNALCASMDVSQVSVERIEAEFEKMLLKSVQPSLGIRWLHSIGRLRDMLPEVYATVGVMQGQKWHPEGDVFEHSMQALDAAAALAISDQRERLIILYAALCHDLGKAVTTVIHEDGRITSYGHDEKGVPLAKSLLKRIMRTQEIIKTVAVLVKYHMRPLMLFQSNARPAAYKRLAYKLAPYTSMRMLADLATADRQGRNPEKGKPLTTFDPEIEEFRAIAKRYDILDHPEPALLQGRDLLDVVAPGAEMGRLLQQAYTMQLNENIHDKEELKQRVLELYNKN